MTIKEIEQATGLPRASVRFYESEGFISPTRGENGYRNYSQSDLDALLKIKLLRQLNIPLEDIRSVQVGARTLDSVLDEALNRLEQDRGQLDRARILCRELRDIRPTYVQLDPQPYLKRLEQPVLPPVPGQPETPAPPKPVYDRLPEAHCPFRRYFARNLDVFFYRFLFMMLCQLAFRINVVSGHPLMMLCINYFVPLGMTLLLEPLMLHFFCTTPGKFLFGLRITRGDGSPLGLREAFNRTVGVLVRGTGLYLPVISTITHGYSLYQIYKGRPLGWDYDLDEVAYWDGNHPQRPYWDNSRSYLKLLLAGVLVAAGIIGLLNSQVAAISPRHQGNITVAQFVENFNDTRRFRLKNGSELTSYLTSDGSFKEAPRPNNVIVIDPYDDAPPLTFDFREEDGFLKEISFSYSAQDSIVSVHTGEMSAAVWSLLYGHPGVDRDELIRVHDEIVALSQQPTDPSDLSFRYDFPCAAITFQLTSRDYLFTGMGSLWPDSEGQPSCQMEFSVCLTD